MPGLTSILEVAKRTLMNQRIAMDVTSHNIANANTVGFSRQRIDFAATEPLRQTYGLIGTGVMTEHIGRLRDQFIDSQVRSATDFLGAANMQNQVLSQIEAMLSEPSDTGLNSTLTQFFNSFQDLATHPEDTGVRNVVLQNGQRLVQAFHTLNSEITDTRTHLIDDMTAKLERINQLAQEISDLDLKITAVGSNNIDPSDSKDQRDLKIDELSKLVNVNVSQDKSGSVMVSVGGTLIASRGGAVALKPLIAGNTMRIVSGATGNDVNITSGELGGLFSMYNTAIPGYIGKLDQMASALITRVNSLHSAGYGLGNPPPTGMNFFTGSDSASIGIDQNVSSNVKNIAASSDGSAGDNSVALAIANAGNDLVLNGNSISVTQFYHSLVSEIGAAVSSADNASKAQDMVLTQLESQRQSVSGVSLDEEMTNMIKFQRSYDAAAKVITTVNEMFQSILQMV